MFGEHIIKKQSEINKSISSSIGQEVLTVEDYLEKGGLRAVLGERRTFGGREYIKTTDGWKFHGKGTGVKAQQHVAHSNGGIVETKQKTAEDMLQHPETKKRFANMFGEFDKLDDEVKEYTGAFHAKTKNYKPNTYYRVENSGGRGSAGVGRGMYVGKDKLALEAFYNIESIGKMKQFTGDPKWLDLVDYKDYDKFEQEAIKKYGKLEGNDHLGKLTLDKKFDGIRYYDPEASGEEFVLFDTSKLKEINSEPGKVQTVLDPDDKKVTGVVKRIVHNKIEPSEDHATEEVNNTAQAYADGMYITYENGKESNAHAGKLVDPNQLPPIIIDKNNWIIDGNNRWRAAKIAKLKEMNVIQVNKTYDEYYKDKIKQQ